MKNAQVIILAEYHGNFNQGNVLADLVKLLRKQGKNIDCVFYELPSDMQPYLKELMQTRDVDLFNRRYYNHYVDDMLKTVNKLSANDPKLPQYIQSVVHPAQGILDDQKARLPFNSYEIETFSKPVVQLIAYDSDSQSEEYIKSLKYAEMEDADPKLNFTFRTKGGSSRPDLLNDVIRVNNVRNMVMSKNISDRFSSGTCHAGLALVGLFHVFPHDVVRDHSQSAIDYKPLSADLAQTGLSNVVFLSIYQGYGLEMQTQTQFYEVPPAQFTDERLSWVQAHGFFVSKFK